MIVVIFFVLNYFCFDVIFFDCDGVLVDSEFFVNCLIWEMLIEFGISISLEDFIKCFLGKVICEELDVIVEMCGVLLLLNWLFIFYVCCNVLFEVEVEVVLYIVYVIDVLFRLGLLMVVVLGVDCMKVELQFNCIGLIEYFQFMDVCIFLVIEVVCSKFVFDVYLLVVSSLGVLLVCCLVIEDSFMGVIVGYVVGMMVLVYVGCNVLGLLIVVGVICMFIDMCELLELLV